MQEVMYAKEKRKIYISSGQLEKKLSVNRRRVRLQYLKESF